MPTIRKHTKPWQPDRLTIKTNDSWAYDVRYGLARWKKYRIAYLKQNRLCVMCKKVDKIKVANTIDHIIPVSKGGDFWNPDNHQALCKACNIRKIRKK